MQFLSLLSCDGTIHSNAAHICTMSAQAGLAVMLVADLSPLTGSSQLCLWGKSWLSVSKWHLFPGRTLADNISKNSGKGKNKSAKLEVRPFMVKNYLWVFVNSMITNPTFDSQVRQLVVTCVACLASGMAGCY